MPRENNTGNHSSPSKKRKTRDVPDVIHIDCFPEVQPTSTEIREVTARTSHGPVGRGPLWHPDDTLKVAMAACNVHRDKKRNSLSLNEQEKMLI